MYTKPDEIKLDTPPVACHMRAGDVVWWHHRILHWPIHNTSESIRQAVIYDYVKWPEACPDGDDGMHVYPRQPNKGSIWDDW